jgi:hypothetical protein
VSRQYAVGSKQAAAAATELNTLAGDLRASIAQFKTGNDEVGVPVALTPADFPVPGVWEEPEPQASDFS